MRKILITITVMCAILCLSLVDCISQESKTPKRGGTLRIADPIAPRTSIGWIADPNALFAGPPQHIFEETFLKSDENGIIKPKLATKYEIAPDLSSLTLTIRKGVKFHDGSDWNAIVAKWNIDQLIKAKLGAYQDVSSVDILDDYTIRLNVTKYTNLLLNTLGCTMVVSKAAYDAHGGGEKAIEWMRFHPVGTGPFKFVSYEPNVSVKGVRFDDYWQEGKPYLDAVEMYFIRDPMTKAASFEAKEMDVIGGDLSRVEYDLQQKGYDIVKGYIGVFCLIPDSVNEESPLSKLKVRQAIDYAIDRDAIVKAYGYGFWETTYQFASPGTSAYVKGLERPYNPEKAKQLLAEAGYPNGLTLKATASVVLANRDVMIAIQGYLSKVGIKMEVNMTDHGMFTELTWKGWKNGVMATAKSLDANMNFAVNMHFTQNSGQHPSTTKSDELQRIWEAAAATPEYDGAMAQKVSKWMFDNAHLTCVYAISRGQVVQPYVHDLGFYTFHNWASWEPENTWFSK